MRGQIAITADLIVATRALLQATVAAGPISVSLSDAEDVATPLRDARRRVTELRSEYLDYVEARARSERFDRDVSGNVVEGDY